MLTEGLEKWLGHRIQAIFVFFVFCSVEVPMYIFPRKKTKFSPFLNSLPACRNLLFVFFDTLKAPNRELFLSEELRLKSEEKRFFDYNSAYFSGLLINQTSYFLFCEVFKR